MHVTLKAGIIRSQDKDSKYILHHFNDHSSIGRQFKVYVFQQQNFFHELINIHIISSGENLIKTNFESAIEVKTASPVKVSQPG